MKKKTEDSKVEEAFIGSHDGSCENPDLHPVLDRGWSWMILFGSFMLQAFVHGVAYSFGIYIDQLIEDFDCSRAEVGLIGSLILGVMWGAGKNLLLLYSFFVYLSSDKATLNSQLKMHPFRYLRIVMFCIKPDRYGKKELKSLVKATLTTNSLTAHIIINL